MAAEGLAKGIDYSWKMKWLFSHALFICLGINTLGLYLLFNY